MFLRSLKNSKMCINPRVSIGLGLGLTLELGFLHIFKAFKELRDSGRGYT